jgi:7,8-dihydro-6-hydroxymethylpterin dimethyltransferase
LSTSRSSSRRARSYLSARAAGRPRAGLRFRKQHRLTLTEVRRRILEQTRCVSPEDLIPVPCHPDALAMAYALKLGGKTVPLTGMVPPEVLIDGAKNTIVYEQEPGLRDHIFKLFATNHSPSSQASR